MRPLSVTDALMYLKDGAVVPTDRTTAETITNFVQKHKDWEYVLDGLDYVKVVEGDVADNWYYVFATIVSEDCLNELVVAWMVEATEKEVMHYVINHMFKATLDYTVLRPYQGKVLQCIMANEDVHIVANLNTEHAH